MSSVLYEVLGRLQKWDQLKGIGVADILFDPATSTVGLVGPALKLENALKYGISNRGYYLNESFAHLFGIQIKVDRWPNTYAVRNTDPMWFHDEGGAEDDSGARLGASIAQFLEEMNGAIKDAMLALGEEPPEYEFDVVLIPSPGFPFTPGKTKELYSAKTKKTVAVDTPPWAIQIKDRDGKLAWAADFCQLMPTICSPSGAVVGRFQDRDMDFIVTHAMPLAEGGKIARYDGAAERLAKCAGMIFPSLAVGVIPAANFGETVLVTKPDLILSSMKPYKERGVWTAVTYSTDVWTETTAGFLQDTAIAAFDQLHGHANPYYTNHWWILGPSIKTEGFADQEVRPITATRGLASALVKKYRVWKRDISMKKFVATSELMTGERYGYLETKINAILDWRCFPLAVCPEEFVGTISKQLTAIGFKGELLAIPVGKEIADTFNSKSTLPREEQEYLQYQYAWMVRDAILTYANTKHSAFFNVVEG